MNELTPALTKRLARTMWSQGSGLLQRLRTIALLLLLPVTCVLALEPARDVQVHGFLTQGYFLTSTNKLFGNSDHGGSLKFTEIGINGSWELTPQLRIAAQLLSRRAGKGSDGEIDLDFGLLDYTALANPRAKAGIRVGRIRLPYGGFWNDARDVAFARPSILLPQSIYPDVIRSTQISGDGGEVYASAFNAWGDLHLQLVGYYPRVDDEETEAGFLLGEREGAFDGRPSFLGRLLYDYGNGRLKLGISGGFNEAKYTPGPIDEDDELRAGTTSYSFYIFSVQYNTEHWSYTAEYKRQPFSNKNYAKNAVQRAFFEDDSTSESYYGQITYRPNDTWEAVARYDVLYANEDDRDGSGLQTSIFNATQGAIEVPGHVTFAKDWMVGLRYNITRDLMVRTEYHRVFGTGWLSGLDNATPLEELRHSRGNWDIFAVLLSYRF